jgi:hypothetical protein
VVYQPEDVHLVRDLLELELKPINEVLKIEKLRRASIEGGGGGAESDVEGGEGGDIEQKTFVVNTMITPMGRPVNVRPQVRWKSISAATQPPPSAEYYSSAQQGKTAGGAQYTANQNEFANFILFYYR